MSIRLEVLLLFLAGMLVTYIPRMLPALFIGKLTFSPKFERFLKLIPYTAMTALIFPGILKVDSNHPAVGLVGGGVAALLAYWKMPLIVCVIGAVLADVVVYLVLE